MSKRHRRKQPSLSIDTRSSNGGGRYRDGGDGVEPSPSKRHHSSSGGGGGQRILLLPDPLSRAREAAARQAQGGDEEVPMLSLQPASPARASFPPQPVASTSAATHDEQGEPKYLVYAPVSPLGLHLARAALSGLSRCRSSPRATVLILLSLRHFFTGHDDSRGSPPRRRPRDRRRRFLLPSFSSTSFPLHRHRYDEQSSPSQCYRNGSTSAAEVGEWGE